jgi:hypothetical protein
VPKQALVLRADKGRLVTVRFGGGGGDGVVRVRHKRPRECREADPDAVRAMDDSVEQDGAIWYQWPHALAGFLA